MVEEKTSNEGQDNKCQCDRANKKWHRHYHHGGGASGAAFFFAFIGVAVYNIQQVHGFWPIVLAILKAIVWPAFLLYHVFSMLHM